MSQTSERLKMMRDAEGYLIRVPAFARLLGCEIDEAKKLIEDGTIPSMQVGKQIRVDPIDAFVLLISRETGRSREELTALPDAELMELVNHYEEWLRDPS